VNAHPFLRKIPHALTQLAAGAVLCLSLPNVLQAQLLIEAHQGGPRQYNGHSAEAYIAAVHFDYAVRVTGITGWINGGENAQVGISSDQMETGFYQDFEAHSPPIHGNLVDPASWQGVHSLKWDLQPGNYLAGISGVGMPFRFGYLGPLSPVGHPDALFVLDRDEGLIYAWGGFGIRIYGVPLSAVPEPATWGVFGALVLAAAVILRLLPKSASAVG
jgi:hypothetical protein